MVALRLVVYVLLCHWMLLGLFVRSSGASFCFQCESFQGVRPLCDALNPDDTLYLVDCTGGYCAKTVRQMNDSVFYTKRTCERQWQDNLHYDCYQTTKSQGFVEISCNCDSSYCNEAGSRLRPDLLISLATSLLALTICLCWR